ncbi:MAG: imidazolonepropionase [Leucobacter sp.]
MVSTLITNISELTTNDVAFGEGLGGRIHNAAVVCEQDQIVWVGSAKKVPSADEQVDADGRALLPGWVDSHTHMVFAGDRSAEFEARMSGQAYSAGGINETVTATRAASDAELRTKLQHLLREACQDGTTTIETKTGYGLTVRDEVRSAQIASEEVDAVTFLGAHVTPENTQPDEYLDLVTGPMLNAVAPFVSAVDVFCEVGAFDKSACNRILSAARTHGLATRVHGNQLGYGPGVQLAVAHGSLSVDHLGFLTDADIDALAHASTVATVLPACDLSTRMPFAPARQLIDAGATIAIASNCNPGTSFTSSIAFSVATAVLQMKLTVEEAVCAATLGGATALGMHLDGWVDPRGSTQPRVGTIAPGARADLHLINAPSVSHFAYRPGMRLTHRVWRAGREYV